MRAQTEWNVPSVTPPRVALQQPLDALAHRARGLVRERHGEDPPWLDAALPHQVGDAVCDYARLARAGPGEDQERAAGHLDGTALRLVEVVQHVRSDGHAPSFGGECGQNRGVRRSDPRSATWYAFSGGGANREARVDILVGWPGGDWQTTAKLTAGVIGAYCS